MGLTTALVVSTRALRRTLEAEHGDQAWERALAQADPLDLPDLYQAWSVPEVTRAAAQARDRGDKLEVTPATQLYTERYMADFLVRHCGVGPGTVFDPACGAGHLLLPAFEACFAHRRAALPDEGAVEAARHVLTHQLFGADLDARAVEVCRRALAARARQLAPGFAGEVPNVWVVSGPLGSLAPGVKGRYDVVLANPPYMGRKYMPRTLVTHLAKHFPDAHRDLFAAFLARCFEWCKPGGTVGVVTMKSWLYQDGFAKLRQRLWRDETLVAFADLGPRAFAPALGLHEGVSVALTCWRHEKPSPAHEVCGGRAIAPPTPEAKAARLADPAAWHRFPQAALADLPGAPFCYDLPDALRAALARGGDLKGRVKQGLATTDNQRFLRFAWELPEGQTRWVPCMRGGTYRKWAGLDTARVDWEGDGARIKAIIPRKYPYLQGWGWVAKNAHHYFQPGLTYGYMAYGALAAREMDGAVFEVASSAVFPGDLDRDVVFATLNARTASWMLRALSQKHMFQAGMVERLPLPEVDPGAVRELVAYCVAAKRRLLRHDPREGAHDPSVWRLSSDEALADQQREAAWLHAAEGALEALVCDGYALDAAARDRLAEEVGTPAGWLPLLAGRELPSPPDGVPAAVLRFVGGLPRVAAPLPLPPLEGEAMPPETDLEAAALNAGLHPLSLVGPPTDEARRRWLEEALDVQVTGFLAARGVALPSEVEAALPPDHLGLLGMPLADWLLGSFFPRHARAYRHRPVVWQLASKAGRGKPPAFSCFVHAHHVDLAAVAALVPPDQTAFLAALQACRTSGFDGEPYEPDWNDGVRVNLAPLQRHGLLAFPVLAPGDVGKAIAQRAEWRADDAAWRREGVL